MNLRLRFHKHCKCEFRVFPAKIVFVLSVCVFSYTTFQTNVYGYTPKIKGRQTNEMCVKSTKRDNHPNLKNIFLKNLI